MDIYSLKWFNKSKWKYCWRHPFRPPPPPLLQSSGVTWLHNTHYLRQSNNLLIFLNVKPLFSLSLSFSRTRSCSNWQPPQSIWPGLHNRTLQHKKITKEYDVRSDHASRLVRLLRNDTQVPWWIISSTIRIFRMRRMRNDSSYVTVQSARQPLELSQRRISSAQCLCKSTVWCFP